MTGYDLSRQWFEMVWETPELNSNHTALYLWLCEIWNKLGQPERFQITSTECIRGMGVKNYKTYKRTFDDLVEMGCLNLLKQSKNQYQCNVIALVEFDKAPTKALTKAEVKARTKAKPIFLNKEPITLNPEPITIKESEFQGNVKTDSFFKKSKNLGAGEKKEEKLIYPFNSDIFKFMWNSWMQYRLEIKKPYKSNLSIQAALKQLSKHNEETAIKMIEQSIANQWQGIFEIKNNNTHGNKQQPTAESLAAAIEYSKKSRNEY